MTVVVANEGNPIPEHALPTRFDPLTRAGLPDRRGMAAGLGLGLYICRCIASAHHGTIRVDSDRLRTAQARVFVIKGSVERVANSLSVTRFTIYNYLDELGYSGGAKAASRKAQRTSVKKIAAPKSTPKESRSKTKAKTAIKGKAV